MHQARLGVMFWVALCQLFFFHFFIFFFFITFFPPFFLFIFSPQSFGSDFCAFSLDQVVGYGKAAECCLRSLISWSYLFLPILRDSFIFQASLQQFPSVRLFGSFVMIINDGFGLWVVGCFAVLLFCSVLFCCFAVLLFCLVSFFVLSRCFSRFLFNGHRRGSPDY